MSILSDNTKDAALGRIENWWERAIAAGWCVATLAKNSGVSVSTLERLFKVKFGKCPHDWIEAVRLCDASGKLHSQMSVKEVAAEMGYANQHHFCVAFKRVFGYPPSQHKRRAKGEGRRAKGEGRRAKGEGRRAKGEGRRAKGEGRRAIRLWGENDKIKYKLDEFRYIILLHNGHIPVI